MTRVAHKGKLLALSSNIRQYPKSLFGTNTLTYLLFALMTKKKSFLEADHKGSEILNFFDSIQYKARVFVTVSHFYPSLIKTASITL
jgi:hypothetical protein